MGDTFGVHHEELAAGAAAWSGPAGHAAQLLAQMRQVLAGAAGAVGSADLAQALMEVDVLNARRLTELQVLFGHLADSVAQTAKGYQATDAAAAQRIRASGRGPSGQGAS